MVPELPRHLFAGAWADAIEQQTAAIDPMREDHITECYTGASYLAQSAIRNPQSAIRNLQSAK
jgi:hypothetical protein